MCQSMKKWQKKKSRDYQQIEFITSLERLKYMETNITMKRQNEQRTSGDLTQLLKYIVKS